MTDWHYEWLGNFDRLSNDGWEVESLFGSVRFDAYNPKTKQAMEFQRVVDIDYIARKLRICQHAKIHLFWLINSKSFKRFCYMYDFPGNRGHTVFALRSCRRRITVVFRRFLHVRCCTFLLDFRRRADLPDYVAESLGLSGPSCYRTLSDSEEATHPMPNGIYVVRDLLLQGDYSWRDRTTLSLRQYDCILSAIDRGGGDCG